MAKNTTLDSLGNLGDRITYLVTRRASKGLEEKAPTSFEDVQDQIRSAIRFMQVSDSLKKSGDYLFAVTYLVENLKYYSSVAEWAKCGHVLLEMADCLFSCEETTISIECCCKAIALLIACRDEYEWARELAATGELLLAAITLNIGGHKDAAKVIRDAKATLSLKEKRTLANEDAHKVTRSLITAYKTEAVKPLDELENMSPRRKRSEERNLRCLLLEWMTRYKTIKVAVENITKGLQEH
jgi:hypothetical protein